ncbi:MAG: epoxyqueuosine reductase [Clostridia bacterium]|nr:epoxyqueuosine reductase [Clostridia bacterium]
MYDITTLMRDFLLDKGADLVGFADLSSIKGVGHTHGISVGIKLPKKIVEEIYDGPTADYYQAYTRTNERLNELILDGVAFLHSKNFKAQAQTTDTVVTQAENRTKLPHKTVAIHAGLGWIGKSNLLITPQYGGAVRLSTILTDAPLKPTSHIFQCLCGDCRICVDACPAQAIKGSVWTLGMDRDEMIDMKACEAMANQLSDENFGNPTATICGICFSRCPFTQRYLNGNRRGI